MPGRIPWTAALGIAGYAVGENWQRIADAFHGPTYIIAGIVAVIGIVAVGILVRRAGRRARRDGSVQMIRMRSSTAKVQAAGGNGSHTVIIR